MAFTYGFYNYSASDADPKLYDAEDISKIFDGIITNGVYAHVGDRFNVTAASGNVNNKVNIGSGSAWFNHTWNYNDSTISFDAPAPPIENKRIDALIIDIDTLHRVNEIKWKQGTASTTPVKPTLTKSGSHFEYALAYITRTAGTTVIKAADIENAVGTSETPYVTGVLQQISASQILASFENQFEGFLNAKESDFETFITNLNASFRQFIDSEDGAFDEYIASKDQDFQDYIAGKTAEFNSVMQSYRNDYYTFKVSSEQTFNGFMVNSRSQFETFMTQSSTDFDNFISSSDDRFESFMSGCQSEFNTYLSGLDSRCEEYIQSYSLVAEGFALGQQNGTDVPSTSRYFHNNAKYHSDLAKTYAQNATSAASSASTSASNAASSETNAANSANAAATSEANAKAYSENAEAVVGIGIATTSRAGIVKPDGETIFVDIDGKITSGISDSDWDVLDNLFA